jgi:hypothetical protein
MAPTPPTSPKSRDVTFEEIAARLTKETANNAAATAQRLEQERQATLTRAAEAEAEAAAAAKERAAAAASAAPGRGGASFSTSSSALPDLASAMLIHESMALLQLHAQAVTVNNIRTHVTIILDVDSGNFNRWRDQFLLVLGKFSL